jgi:hypothetical protein
VSFIFGFMTAVVVVPMVRAFVEGWKSASKPRPLKRPRRKTEEAMPSTPRQLQVIWPEPPVGHRRPEWNGGVNIRVAKMEIYKWS